MTRLLSLIPEKRRSPVTRDTDRYAPREPARAIRLRKDVPQHHRVHCDACCLLVQCAQITPRRVFVQMS